MKTETLTPTNCARCDAALPIFPAGHCGGSGYAIMPDGSRICYICADKAQRDSLKNRDKGIAAYLSGDKITTWAGGELMRVTHSRSCKLTRQSYTHDRNLYRSIHAIDCHGGHWSGRGSDGIAIKLRPVKG